MALEHSGGFPRWRRGAWLLGAATLAAGSAVLEPGPSSADDARPDPAAELLQQFRCAFSKESCPQGPDAPSPPAPPCFQPPIARFLELRSVMDPATVAEIEGYLRSRGPARSCGFTYISPLGLFEFTYETTGPDSVPSEDVDPVNGIPDFVERCGEYADDSWTTEAGLGFAEPLLPTDGTYDIVFQGLGPGFYGYTDVAGPTTTIVLNSTFTGQGFPGNDDPDGPVAGRAKATIAHELRHASQYTNNGWSEESSWDELDAGWIEDIVYPLTNDYINFLGPGSLSQLDAPWIPMDSTSVNRFGYEDCLWNHYLSGTYGVQIIVDLWASRAETPTAPMIESYTQAQALYSTGWNESYPGYLEWCWFTGWRALPTFGFPDAPKLPSMDLSGVSSVYPYAVSDTVAALAGHPRRFNKGPATGFPRILFDGDDSASCLTVSVILVEPDLTFTITRPPLGPGNTLNFVVPLRFPEVKYLGVLVTNSDLSGEAASYTLEVEDDTVTSVEPADGADGSGDAPALPILPSLAMAPPSPNPSTRDTRIRWTLPVPGPISVRVLDVHGRVVRTLTSAQPSGTSGATSWDGRTDHGRRAASGVYWVRLDTEQGTRIRPLVRLR